MVMKKVDTQGSLKRDIDDKNKEIRACKTELYDLSAKQLNIMH